MAKKKAAKKATKKKATAKTIPALKGADPKSPKWELCNSLLWDRPDELEELVGEEVAEDEESRQDAIDGLLDPMQTTEEELDGILQHFRETMDDIYLKYLHAFCEKQCKKAKGKEKAQWRFRADDLQLLMLTR